MFFIGDRALKTLALQQTEAKLLLGKVFLFNFTKNYNISFSLPLSGPILNISIIVIILGLIFVIYKLILKEKCLSLKSLLLTFILFGAISNMVDRLQYGYVIDYLELKYFTVFNLADVMISCGVLILIVSLMRDKKYVE
ncbi:MAG: signal peptidase II [Patescibacteria group bacterium]|jgi:signal peptidase II